VRPSQCGEEKTYAFTPSPAVFANYRVHCQLSLMSFALFYHTNLRLTILNPPKLHHYSTNFPAQNLQNKLGV
jgi:hypothetical protein